MKHLSIRKNTLAALAVALGITTLGATSVYAAQNTFNQGNPHDELVESIATKFNLNETEVQAVFDAQHEEMETQMKENRNQQLQEAVTNGDLTQEQMDAIVGKMNEMEAERESEKESFDTLSHEERHEKMEEKRTELEAWANENGISEEYLPQMGKGKGGMGMGRHGFSNHQEMKNSDQETTTQE